MTKQIDVKEINLALAQTQSLSALISFSRKYLNEFKIKEFAYQSTQPVGISDNDLDPIIYLSGFPTEYIERYKSAALYKINPYMSRPLAHARPLLWNEISNDKSLSAKERCFISSLTALGPKNGISIPVFGPRGFNGTVSLGLNYNTSKTPDEKRLMIQMVAQTIHMKVYDFLTQNQNIRPLLSAREKEILSQIMLGKSNPEIATSMKLSRYTIGSYVRHLFLKLKVNNRVSAALIGQSLGL